MESSKDYDLNDSHIIYLINENNEDAKEYLFSKYKPLINKEVNRVKKMAYKYNIEINDIKQEALLAFTNAINNYDDNENTKFITFATVCIRRKLISYINKHKTNKNKINIDSVTIDNSAGEDMSLLDKLEDTTKEPLNKLLTNEKLNETYKKAKKLSKMEQTVLNYSLENKSAEEISKLMGINIKKVYNYLYRARLKLK